jgi:hypothetical protein
VCLSFGTTWADPTTDGEARLHYQTGVQRYDVRDWQGARTEFERAYSLSHNKDLLYNIAVCYREDGQFARALDYFRRYIAAAGPTVLDIERVRRQISDLEQLLPPRLVVTNRWAAAAVTIDGEVRGTTPLSLDVSAGPHAVEGRLPSGARERHELLFAPGEQKTLALGLRDRRGLWIGLGTGFGAVVLGGVATALAVTLTSRATHAGSLPPYTVNVTR